MQAERGTDELVSLLVERFHQVAREYEVVLVLGSDFAATQLPDELALNARLANEFGASVIAVVGGKGRPRSPSARRPVTPTAPTPDSAATCWRWW